MTYRGVTTSVLPTGGLNNGYDPVNIGESETPDCQNIRFRNNACVKRDGIAKFINAAAGSSFVQGIAELIKENGTTFQTVTAGGKAYLSSAGSWSDITGAVTINSGQNAIVSCAQLADILCFTNNIDAPWKYTGAGNISALGGAPATCQGFVAYKNYLITLQAAGSIGKAQWSAINNPASWPAANTNTFLNQQGQKGMGFGVMGDQLYVFFDRSIHQMAYTGDSITPFVFPVRHPSIGAVSGGGIVAVDDAIFFPSVRGIYRFDGSNLEYVSGKIEATWRSLNKSRLQYIQAIKNERYNEIWFAVSTGANTQHDTVLCYDYQDRKWSIFKHYNVNCFGLYPSAQPIDPIIGGVAGQVWRGNTGAYTDDGQAIDAYWLTKPNILGDPTRLRQVDQVRLIATSDSTAGASIEVSTAYNLEPLAPGEAIAYAASGASWDSATWDVDEWSIGAGTQGLDYTTRPKGHGRMFQMKLRNNQNNVTFAISAALLSYRARRGEE